jgi:hypothetical protein
VKVTPQAIELDHKPVGDRTGKAEQRRRVIGGDGRKTLFPAEGIDDEERIP